MYVAQLSIRDTTLLSRNMSQDEKYGVEEQQLDNVDLTGYNGDYVPASEQEETRIIRKLDFRLLPFVFVLYSLSVLDRSNLGNARLAGLVRPTQRRKKTSNLMFA